MPKLVDEDQIYKIKKFDNVFSTNEDLISKENSIWGEKFKFGCLRTQLDFFKRFIWIYWGFNCKKNWFLKSI